nr:uncharacterized protein LOC112805474 [Arachis hypogaea]
MWRNAINDNLLTLEGNRTWSLTLLPAEKKGNLLFSSVVKMTTLRLILAIAAIKGWHLHQLDVNTTLLHGDLPEEVYMRVPPADYIQSKNDYLHFTKASGSKFTIVLVYINNLVMVGNDIDKINDMKRLVDEKFNIKDLGKLKFFLGMEISRSQSRIPLYRHKYTLDLLQDFGMLSLKPTSTPMSYNTSLSKDTEQKLEDITKYRQLVGRIIYLTNMRPDISFVVGKLSQYLDFPTDAHFKATLHVLKYVKNAFVAGLFFKSSSDLSLLGFTDSNWVTCADTRCSISGQCFFLGTSLISWKSKKQTTVEGQWLLYLLKYLKIDYSMSFNLYCDNKLAMHLAANPAFYECRKHIEVDCHITRKKAQVGVLKLLPVSSAPKQ